MERNNTSQLSRRNFLKISGLTTAYFSIGFYSPLNAENTIILKTAEAEQFGIELNSWMYIDTNGKVTLICHKSEMGQGIYHAIPQIIAEELEVNLNDIKVQFGQGNQKKYGNQITGGSFTIRAVYKNLLKLAASAREMLISAAATKWGVAKNECYAENGHIIHKPTGKKGHYGEFVTDAVKLETPKDIKLKDISEYKLIRKPLQRLDMPIKVNGKAIFGLDKRLDGMLFAAVERNPRLRGKVKSFDASEALKIAGVKKVFKVKMAVFGTYREGVAVVATSTWAAFKGKKALKVEWDDTGFEHINTEDIYKRQKEALQKEEGLSFRKNGDPSVILEKSAKKLDFFYETPYQSHSCMEPLNCVAHYQSDKVEIWGPIQAPDWVQDCISKEMGIARDNVIVNMTFLGGGFGRKAFMDYPHEATLISKEMGTPIQVVWTREDDMTQGPYRPGISYRCEGVIENGEIAALKFKIAGQNNDHWRDGDRAKGRANRSTSEGFLKPYFDSIKNLSIADIPFETPIPTMWWRSVYASTNGFAFESFLDEMAHEAQKDPLEFRRQNLKEDRLHQLIDKMQAVSGWKNREKGYGTAITECFGSTCGHVVKVSKKAGGGVKIDKVWAVIDCGWYVNPDTIEAQVQGAIVMALGAATQHAISFKEGMTEQHNFHEYLMPRMPDAPVVEVHIMDNKADAGGVGEPGLPAFAPALANAIFDLTGKRIRKLPFELDSI